MTNIIEGMNILRQTSIKEYTALSDFFIGFGVSIILIVIIVFCIKTKNKNQIMFNNRENQIFLFFYILGLAMVLITTIQFPWFYVETGRYTYECTFDDRVSVNSIDEKFNIICVEDGVWTIEDK